MQDYDSCELVFSKVTGGSLLDWSFKLDESLLDSTDQTLVDIPVSSASLTPNTYQVDADGALSLDPALASAGMSFRVPSPVPTPMLAYGDIVQVTYKGAMVFQGVVAQVAVEVELESFNMWAHDYTYSLTDVAAGMLNSGPGVISVPAEDALTRLQRFFTVDVSLLSTEQLDYILGLVHEAQEEQDKTFITWAREFTELTEVPLRMTPAEHPIWSALQIFPHPVAWNGVQPTPDITDEDPCWINRLVEEQSLATAGALLPVRVQVTANDTTFLAGFGNVSITPARLGLDFKVGVSRLGASAAIPFGFTAGSVVEIGGSTMAISKLTHVFAAKKYVANLELARPVEITT
jgi:hypothetical protein